MPFRILKGCQLKDATLARVVVRMHSVPGVFDPGLSGYHPCRGEARTGRFCRPLEALDSQVRLDAQAITASSTLEGSNLRSLGSKTPGQGVRLKKAS